MLMVQDQYSQNYRKNYHNELQLKQDTSKQLYSEPQVYWENESGGEEEVLTSGNDSDEDEILYEEPYDFPEVQDTKRKISETRKKPKNVRFEGTDYDCIIASSETSSAENEYQEVDCVYIQNEPHVHGAIQKSEIGGHKTKKDFRIPQDTGRRSAECSYNPKYNYERRPKSNPEKSSYFMEPNCTEKRPISLGDSNDPRESKHRLRRKKEHKCSRGHHSDVCHEVCRKSCHKPYKIGCGDESFAWQYQEDSCDCYPSEEVRSKSDIKTYTRTKPSNLKNLSYVESYGKTRLPQNGHYDHQALGYYGSDKYYQEEYYDHGYSSKSKKKVLEAVQEQQEQFSDSTYKVPMPCTKRSSHTIPIESSGFPMKKSIEKLSDSSRLNWHCCGMKGSDGSFGMKTREVIPRIPKMRSRRTRMNRLKNGWKKAFVQTVRDGMKNERVGVLVMGSKGPEFYAKNTKSFPNQVLFSKPKSNLEKPAKSFEVMTVDCKNVFLSSSETGTKANFVKSELLSPEDDIKMEEKMAKFSKNVHDIVKNSEEKFYKTLSNDYHGSKQTSDGIFKGAGEGSLQDKRDENNSSETARTKYATFQAALGSLSPKISKTKKPEKVVNEQSKAMADALNEQAKQYKERLKNREETLLEDLKELEKKYPPKELPSETIEANLSFWGIKLDDLSEKADGFDNKPKEMVDSESKTDTEFKEEGLKDKKTEGKEGVILEESQSCSVKSTEPIGISNPRRKSYFEATMSKSRTIHEEQSCSGDAAVVSNSKTEHSICTKTSQDNNKMKKWTESSGLAVDGNKQDSSFISTVFRNLIEKESAMSQEESKSFQNIYNEQSFNPEECSNYASSSSVSDVQNAMPEEKIKISQNSQTVPSILEETKAEDQIEIQTNELPKMVEIEVSGKPKKKNLLRESDLEELNRRKVLKMKNYVDERVLGLKVSKKAQTRYRDGKSKKRIVSEEKMKLFREALPGLAAENEAAHLKQLKKYIDRFIDRVEASTTSEFRRKKETRLKSKESGSTDSGEVKVDARKILEFVSNPFKKISSDITINIAKKLTDALVQDKSPKTPRVRSTFTKARKALENSSTDEEGVRASSGSGKSVINTTTLLQGLGFFAVLTCGCLCACGVLYIVKKYK